MTDPEPLTCYIHPNRETLLRCNHCERPICTQCAIQVPTGYRCRECVRGQQKVFNTATFADFILAPLISLLLSLAGSYAVAFLGFFTLFLAPLVGTFIAEVVKRFIHGHRSKTLFTLVAAGVILGSLPLLLMRLLPVLAGLGAGGLNLLGLLPLTYQVIYTVLVTGSIYYRLSGISL